MTRYRSSVYCSGHTPPPRRVDGRYPRPLALGGHVFVQVDRGNVPGARLFDDHSAERPALYRCRRCGLVLVSWAVVERFYPMPCPARTRAVTAAGS